MEKINYDELSGVAAKLNKVFKPIARMGEVIDAARAAEESLPGLQAKAEEFNAVIVNAKSQADDLQERIQEMARENASLGETIDASVAEVARLQDEIDSECAGYKREAGDVLERALAGMNLEESNYKLGHEDRMQNMKNVEEAMQEKIAATKEALKNIGSEAALAADK